MRRKRRPPGGIVGQIRLRVASNDADDDLADDAPADVAQAVAAAADRRFAEDVQPQWRLVWPVAEGEFLARERQYTDGVRDGFARWQRGAHPALEVTRGQRSVGTDLDRARDGFGKPDQRRGELSVDRFRALCRWVARHVKE